MDPLERLVEDFSQELTPDGWTVLLRPGLGTPDKEGEHMEVVFKHPLVGERGLQVDCHPDDFGYAAYRVTEIRHQLTRRGAGGDYTKRTIEVHVEPVSHPRASAYHRELAEWAHK